MAKRNIHISAVILFGIALFFYLTNMATTASFFGLLGVVFELAGWITWLKSSTAKNAT